MTRYKDILPKFSYRKGISDLSQIISAYENFRMLPHFDNIHLQNI